MTNPLDRIAADLDLDAAREAHRRDAAMIDCDATERNTRATEGEGRHECVPTTWQSR